MGLDRAESLKAVELHCSAVHRQTIVTHKYRHTDTQMLFSSCSLTCFNNSGEWLTGWLAMGSIHGLCEPLHTGTQRYTHTELLLCLAVLHLCSSRNQTSLSGLVPQGYDLFHAHRICMCVFASVWVWAMYCILWYLVFTTPYVQVQTLKLLVLIDCVNAWGRDRDPVLH